MKLVHKLTGLQLLSACVVLGVYGYLTVVSEKEMFEEAVAQDGLLIARTMRVSLVKVWKAEGEGPARLLLADASTSEEELTFQLLSIGEERSGERLRGPPLGEDAISGLEAGREVVQILPGRPSVLRVCVPIKLPGQSSQVLLLEESLEKEDAHLVQTKLRIGVVTLTLILVSGFLAFAVGNRIVGRPMQALMEKADRVGKGDLEEALDLVQEDEIGDLATHMNIMCENLARERAERVGAEEQLRHAERLSTVGALAAGIAHELGTPLNVILGRALMNAGSSTAEVEKNSRIIVEETERVTSIIRQLLDFARRDKANRTPRDVREIVRSVAELLEPMASEADLTIETELPPHEIPVAVDSVQIQQALMNVIVNGIQATAAGGSVSLRAEVYQRPEGSGPEQRFVALIIEDQGRGIPPEEQGKIFEPFFTTKDVGKGTGLGLSVAHGIVKDHAGWFEVESEPGQGSRFVIHLPVLERSA